MYCFSALARRWHRFNDFFLQFLWATRQFCNKITVSSSRKQMINVAPNLSLFFARLCAFCHALNEEHLHCCYHCKKVHQPKTGMHSRQMHEEQSMFRLCNEFGCIETYKLLKKKTKFGRSSFTIRVCTYACKQGVFIF